MTDQPNSSNEPLDYECCDEHELSYIGECPKCVAEDTATSSDGLVERTVGKWLSAALDDPNVCDEMKADINEFFLANSATSSERVSNASELEARIEQLTRERDDLSRRLMKAIEGMPE